MNGKLTSLMVGMLGVAAMIAAPCFGITNDLATSGGTISWSFETHTNGEDIVNTAVDSWYGDPGSFMAVETNYTQSSAGYPLSSTGHTVIAELSANVTNLLTSDNAESIWLDHLVQPRRWDQDGHPSDVPADAQMAYYVNTNGHVVLYHRPWNTGDPGSVSNVWTEINEITIATDAWVRVSINMDYDSNYDTDGASLFYQVKVDGVLITNANAVGNPYTGGYGETGSYFVMATHDSVRNMNAISLHGTGFFDDFVVSTNAPVISMSYIIASSIDPSDASGGTMSPLGDVVVADGGSTSFTATAESYWLIEKVVISHNGVTTTNLSPASPFTTNLVNVTENGSIAATFVAETTNGVPVYWMVQHGIQGQDPNDNPDGDALTTKQEWLASTHPTNASNFEITSTWQADGTNYVEWVCTGVDPALPPIDVMRSTNLTAGFAYYATKAREEGTNTWSEAAPSTATFYQIAATNAP